MPGTSGGWGALILLVAMLLVGCGQPSAPVAQVATAAKGPSPGEVVRAWNDALGKGDVKGAAEITSSTSDDHIKRNFVSLEQLSKIYQATWKDKKIETKIVHEEVSGDTAIVVYRVKYGDNGVKYWMDKCLREGGVWKVAPQFVQTLTLKE